MDAKAVPRAVGHVVPIRVFYTIARPCWRQQHAPRILSAYEHERCFERKPLRV
jgi:hypothetical protein